MVVTVVASVRRSLAEVGSGPRNLCVSINRRVLIRTTHYDSRSIYRLIQLLIAAMRKLRIYPGYISSLPTLIADFKSIMLLGVICPRI